MMTFSPASLGRKLFDLPEKEIIDIYLGDLDDIFPGFADIVTEARVERFEYGSPYCFPGTRASSSPSSPCRLNASSWPATSSAPSTPKWPVSSGFTAAQEAASLLSTERQTSLGR